MKFEGLTKDHETGRRMRSQGGEAASGICGVEWRGGGVQGSQGLAPGVLAGREQEGVRAVRPSGRGPDSHGGQMRNTEKELKGGVMKRFM